MTNSLVVKAASLIREGDIAGAEYALVNLADTEGDYALVAALEELPPKDLLAVIREFDVIFITREFSRLNFAILGNDVCPRL